MAGWTDYNLADGVFKNKLLGSTCEALRLAIVERCQASNTTIPDSLQDEISTNSIPSKTWRNDFQSTITTLIPKFTNHTDNSGNWQGQTSIPAWTEADILTAIEAESRISAPDFFNAAWAEQQYKILNLLRWVMLYSKYYTSFGLQLSDAYLRRGEAIGSSSLIPFLTVLADAISNWNSNSWNSVGAGVNCYCNSQANFNFGRWGVQFVTVVAKMKANNYLFSENQGCLIDFYSLAWGYEPSGYSYNSIESYAKNQLQLITSTSESIDEFIYSDEFGNRERQINPTETMNYNMYLGPSYWNPLEIKNYAIAKFTGENGFQFKDW